MAKKIHLAVTVEKRVPACGVFKNRPNLTTKIDEVTCGSCILQGLEYRQRLNNYNDIVEVAQAGSKEELVWI